MGQTESARNSAGGGEAERRTRSWAASSTASPARSGKIPSVPSATGASTAAAISRLRAGAPQKRAARSGATSTASAARTASASGVASVVMWASTVRGPSSPASSSICTGHF